MLSPTLMDALKYFQDNQLVEAEAVCRKIIAKDGIAADLIELLSVIEAKNDHKEAALHLMRLRLCLMPISMGTIQNLAKLLELCGKFSEAAALIGRLYVLEIRKDSSSLFYHKDGRLSQAAIDLRLKQARLLKMARHNEAALLLLINPIIQDRLGIEGLALAANLASDSGKLDQAIDLYRKAIKLEGNKRLVYLNLATIYYFQEKYLLCTETLQSSAHYQESHADYLALEGLAQAKLNHFDQARELGLKAIAVATAQNLPTLKEIKNNHCSVLIWDCDFDLAEVIVKQLLREEPENITYLSQYGLVLRMQKRFAEALRSYDKAIQLNPNDPSLRFCYGLIQLAMGDYANGFANYEWRIEENNKITGDYGFYFQAKHLHLQKGLSLQDKHVLVYTEQGYGDMLQFSRFLPLLAKQVKRLTLYLHRPEINLDIIMPDLPPNLDFVLWPNPIPHSDYHVPLLSLANILGIDKNTIPAPTRFMPPSTLKQKWNAWLVNHKLLPSDDHGAARRPLIGISANGRAIHTADHRRSIGLEKLQMLLNQNANFILLEPSILPENQAYLNQHPHNNLYHIPDAFQDFANSAALIENLDLVISVDTAVAHLAAGLEVPVFLLIASACDWRWELNQSNSPWYPDIISIYRQITSKNWNPPLLDIIHDLKEMVKNNPSLTLQD